MRSLTLTLCVLFATCANAQELDPKKTHALVVGVLNARAFKAPSPSPAQRQDRALLEALIARGVPRAQTRLLLDSDATLARIDEALTQVTKALPTDGTLLLYYAGHGFRHDDEVVLLNHDYDAARWKETGLTLTKLGDWLEARVPRGARTLLLADCAYRSGLRRVATRLQKSGRPAASLTSVAESNVPLGGWTTTMHLIAGLRGDPLVDRNADGAISLQELAAEVADAMKYRERQRAGFHLAGIPSTLRLARTRPEATPSWTGGIAYRSYVSTWVEEKRRRGRVVGRVGERYVVRLQHSPALAGGQLLPARRRRPGEQWTDVLLPESRLHPVTLKTYPIGTFLRVRRGRFVFPAKVLSVERGFHRITYPGLSKSWREWILAGQVLGTTQAVPDLTPTEAKTRASCKGRYQLLLKRIFVPADLTSKGPQVWAGIPPHSGPGTPPRLPRVAPTAFKNSGYWGGTKYAGFTNLPPGYWVYVYPHWYIWKLQPELEPTLKPLRD